MSNTYSYTPSELWNLISNCNCLTKISYDSDYLYFTGLSSNDYGIFSIPKLKNFILEYDLVCLNAIYPCFNPTFNSYSIPSGGQNYGFMVAMYARLEIWKGSNLSVSTNNTRMKEGIDSTLYSNAVSLNTSVHVTIQKNKNYIKIFLNNILYQEVYDNNYIKEAEKGYFGFFNWSGSSCKINNFTITEILNKEILVHIGNEICKAYSEVPTGAYKTIFILNNDTTYYLLCSNTGTYPSQKAKAKIDGTTYPILLKHDEDNTSE